MPPVRMRGDGRKARNPKKTLLRLLGYMKRYLPILALVLVCIFLSSYAQTAGSAALGKLVDDYILPMVATGSTDFGPLLLFLVKLGALLGLGLVCAFLYNSLMVGVRQSVDKMRTGIRQYESACKSVDQARKGYDIAVKRYDTGAGTLLEVNDSQLALTQSQLNRSQAVYSYLVAQAQLDETLGTEYTYEK